MKVRKRRQRLVVLALALALLASLGLASASSLAVVDRELLVNGSFEKGFINRPGCGMVGKGWGCFTNGGTVAYGFYDDQWKPVVANGKHSQLIELNTMQYAASESDRYAGIYQTVKLVPGHTYQLKLQGLMREQNPDPNEDPYRYRVQWGYTANGSTDWEQVTNWEELPWDKIDERTAPTGLQSFQTEFVAPSGKITLFFRVWKKWGTAYKELDVNLDAISLWGRAGPLPCGVVEPCKPAKPVKPVKPVKPCGTAEPCGPVEPMKPTVEPGACSGPNYIANGSFESGFVKGVGKNWKKFTNGGLAAYGFYDDKWPPVVQDGKHSQLIEINTKGMPVGDSNRYAGIWQVVKGLKPGATYEFSLWGEMREEAAHPDEDQFRYRVQWGYVAADASPSQKDIKKWVELPWDDIFVRETPGPMSFYSVKFRAPSAKVVIGIRAWKKWGTPYRELDVNLDKIRLVKCAPLPPPCEKEWCEGNEPPPPACADGSCEGTEPPTPPPCENGWCEGNEPPPPACADGSCEGAEPPAPPSCADGSCQGSGWTEPPPPADPPPSSAGCTATYIVARGDMLYRVASKHHTTVAALAEANHIANPDRIFVGQKLCIVAP